MKKNYVMRFAAVLLVLVLLSTCVVSGTFAKYVTSDDAQDEARVAKWGIELTVTGDEVLYDDAKTGNEVDLKVSANNLCAPGTYQKLATVALTGTPEVAYEITVTVDLNLGENWKVSDADYCPVVFTVDGTSIKMDTTNDTVAKLEAAVEKAIIIAIAGGDGSSNTVKYDANDPVPATANNVLIDWAWAFEGDNVKDTALGDAAADGTAPTIDFSLTVTVTQVD